MKLRLMDIIVCPKCKVPFKLEIEHSETRDYSQEWFEKVDRFWAKYIGSGEKIDMKSIWSSYRTEIIAGELRCESCGEKYPIEHGIPRILSPELRTISQRMGRGIPETDEKISTMMDEIDPVKHEEKLFTQIQMANQSNYGYEWQAFSHEYNQWEYLYKRNYVSEADGFFDGKLGLDAGCGNARYTLPPVNNGAEMVGLDLSSAIEVAYSKSVNVPTMHIIQGDIYNLPFKKNYFDFAQSLGVVHITPDPEGALLAIKKVVKPKKKIFLYVYKTFEDENMLKHHLLKIASFMRRFTVKLPSNQLYYLLYLMVPVVLLIFYLPSWLLWQIPAMRKFSLKLPYNYEQYGNRRLRDMHMNLFDRFGNPVERRYNHQQMQDWMNRADFESFTLKAGYGWTVTAVKRGS